MNYVFHHKYPNMCSEGLCRLSLASVLGTQIQTVGDQVAERLWLLQAPPALASLFLERIA